MKVLKVPLKLPNKQLIAKLVVQYLFIPSFSA